LNRLLEHLNPLNNVSADRYVIVWQGMFSTILEGFWGRLLALAFFILSFWFGVRRRNFAAATAFFVLALLFTYGAPILRFLRLL
jgi:hypothetical protein